MSDKHKEEHIFAAQYENAPRTDRQDILDAATKRRPLTRRVRLGLAAWHLKCALAHLWRVLRGGR